VGAAELLAAAPGPVGEGRGVEPADGAGAAASGAEADGAGSDREPGAGRLIMLWPGSARLAAWSCCPAAGGGTSAAHLVNGASGPPAIATATAARQTASAIAEMPPIRRMARRRRPEGSVNTGLECTSRSVAMSPFAAGANGIVWSEL
jgi:hypothetical protein